MQGLMPPPIQTQPLPIQTTLPQVPQPGTIPPPPFQQQFQQFLPGQQLPFSYSPNNQPNFSQQIFQPAPPVIQPVPCQVMSPPYQQSPSYCFQPMPQSPVSTQNNPCLYSQGAQSNVAQGFTTSPPSRTDFTPPPPSMHPLLHPILP